VAFPALLCENAPVTEPGEAELWRSLFDGSPDYIFTVALDGRITSLNHPGPGRSSDEFVGLTVFDAALPEDRPAVAALLARVTASGKAEIHVGSSKDPDGRLSCYESRFIPVLRDGAVVSFVVVTRDVSAERQAREDLVASEQRFRTLIENSADAICLFDADGLILYANPSTKRVLDYDPQSLVGVNGWTLLHPDDHAAMQNVLEQLLAGPATSIEIPRYRLRRRDDGWRWVEAMATNLFAVPSVGALMARIRDVTSRVQLEEQLRQSQKMEAIGLLAGGVAHDFNNLLTVVLGCAESALRTAPLDEPISRDLAQIKQAAEGAAQLTQKLLTFSRRQIRQTADFDLCDLLRGFGSLLGRVLGEDIAVDLVLPPSPLLIEGDQAQLQQVVLNLATNARQAMASGGRLRLAARALTPNRCELTVADTGEGMSDETRARVFEPFFTTRPGGTGLGLSVVYGVVQDHHGSLEIESERGRGTTVRVELPLCGGAAARPLRARPKVLGGSETLLVAEDEPLLRELVARELRRLGYTVLLASDGEEAARIFERERDRIAAVVLDVIMPRLGGRQAFVRMEELRPGVPVLFVSGYAPEAAGIAELVASGRVALVPKPFLTSELASRIRALLDRERGRPTSA
jgi:two-component system cell cycle sensor histidine kinase/response regulator CckA